MYTPLRTPLHAESQAGSVQRTTAGEPVQKQALPDNRPEAVAQRKLVETMNNSPRVAQLRALSDAMHASPRMVALRHQMNGLRGVNVPLQGNNAMPTRLSPARRDETPDLANLGNLPKSASDSLQGLDTASGEAAPVQSGDASGVQLPLQMANGNQTSRLPRADHDMGDAKNDTGLPDRLKLGIERLSGYAMDDVRVHYNSSKPAQLQARAYAQGTMIHIGPGQEQHLPHEAWHVVQQKQGRVRATRQTKGKVHINDDAVLEREADIMGARALRAAAVGPGAHIGAEAPRPPAAPRPWTAQEIQVASAETIQRKTEIVHTTGYLALDDPDNKKDPDKKAKKHYKVGKTMLAKLDVNDPIKGSATGATWNWMQTLRAEYGNVIKGHLLNHDLGGFATEENIYPITSAANHEHSASVEQPIKTLLFNEANGKGRRLWYQVNVVETNPHDPTEAEFQCSWGWDWTWTSKWTTEDTHTVKSTMKRGGNYGGFGGLPDNKYNMLTNDYSQAWYHGSRREDEKGVVNQSWKDAHTGGQITVNQGWWSVPIFGVPLFGPNIDATKKTSWTNLPAMVKEDWNVAEPIIGKILTQVGTDRCKVEKHMKASVQDAVAGGLKLGLQTGAKRPDEVNKSIRLQQFSKLLNDVWAQVAPKVSTSAGEAAAKLTGTIQANWTPGDKAIISGVKDKILDEVLLAVDEIPWPDAKAPITSPPRNKTRLQEQREALAKAASSSSSASTVSGSSGSPSSSGKGKGKARGRE